MFIIIVSKCVYCDDEDEDVFIGEVRLGYGVEIKIE